MGGWRRWLAHWNPRPCAEPGLCGTLGIKFASCQRLTSIAVFLIASESVAPPSQGPFSPGKPKHVHKAFEITQEALGSPEVHGPAETLVGSHVLFGSSASPLPRGGMIWSYFWVSSLLKDWSSC